MHNYKELKIWQKSIDLVENVFQLIRELPLSEKYGLIDQIKRSAISVPSNIAEGAGRNSNKDFRRFLSISKGSLNELNTQLIISNRLNFIDNDKLNQLEKDINEIQKIIYKFNQNLESKNN
ncbi:four helix bundle protein [Psychroflexus halocasei]|uniref:Four helix bundle protein n=1 Tax=Psychroflexus halocasei TaxID=908615 RepID=A0A1H3Y2L2_9FLAO|nr:four helix bundle protein [Psychroflexus halocasei]SEA05813.1 four helix bundle protein [Psychroflexus halocasei]